MTALNRTAYPYFKQAPDPDELAELYTPTAAELALAKKRVNLVPNRLSFLVLLKSFQRLGYFPHPEVIPEGVITHIREQLGLDAAMTVLPQQTPVIATTKLFATTFRSNPTAALPSRWLPEPLKPPSA